MSTPGGNQTLTIISESGLFAAILKSRKAEAKRFRRWVTGEVLPSIRRTGRYETEPPPPAAPLLAGWDSARLSACVGMLRVTMRLFGEAAAREQWIELGLPARIAQMPVDARDALMGRLLRFLDDKSHVASKQVMTELFGLYTPSNYEKACTLLRAAGWMPQRIKDGRQGSATLWFPPRRAIAA